MTKFFSKNMIIVGSDGKHSVHYCPGEICQEKAMNNFTKQVDCSTATIPHYTTEGAIAAGWVLTYDILFCNPEKNEGVWVCPDCAERYGLSEGSQCE